MKKFAVLLAAVAALVAASFASANTGLGSVHDYNSGAATPYANISIHNNTTGANGSTWADASGNFQIGGTVPGQSYTISASSCRVHTRYVSDPLAFAAPSGPYYTGLSLFTYAYGGC